MREVSSNTPETRARRHILIVDDDPVFTLMADETLQQAGFGTRVAQTGRTALALIDECAPDLLLLDVELPDINGFDICAAVRARRTAADIPAVMVTGHDDTESITRAFKAGATDFIHKPVLWQTLAQRIDFILRAHDNIRALRLSEQKNRALLQALPDTIYIANADGILLEHITGDDQANRDSHVGKSLDDILSADASRAAREAMDGRTKPQAITTCDFEVGRGADRRSFEARFRSQPGDTLLIVIRDTTEKRRAESRIRNLAYFDTLTGLPNRQLLVHAMSRAIPVAKATGTLIALLYLDLDRFKRINDNLGHAVGDSLLKSVARRLEQCLRATKCTRNPQKSALDGGGRVARLGGDEFVVLLAGLTEENQATDLAQRIGQSLGEPFDCEGHRFVVTPSIGIAFYPRDGSDIEDLLVKADMAMYKAKDQGRNGHAFYGESMAVRSLGRLQLENDLRVAFEAGDFRIHYQPKVDLATDSVIGVECLLRWHHSDRGWIGPDAFVPVAEESGMIVALGEWVIRKACKQLRDWAGTSLSHLVIAVNVSVQQFARADFVDTVLGILGHYGVPPQQLELEITESLLLRNIEDTTTCMRRFRAAGLAISIDDFGTGYSSLGYLRTFPVDALKIDRSFVKDLHTSGDGGAICAAIIALARELKLKVVAEGVESPAQLEFLRKHRCDQVQGYLISPPVPVEDLELLLRAAQGRLLPPERRQSRQEHGA